MMPWPGSEPRKSILLWVASKGLRLKITTGSSSPKHCEELLPNRYLLSDCRKRQPTVQNHGGNFTHINHSVEQEGNLPVGVSNGEHIVGGVIVPNQIFRAILEADFRHGAFRGLILDDVAVRNRESDKN